jgi:hypothetical protein
VLWYHINAKEGTIILISNIQDYVGMERRETTKNFEKYLSDILSDHCKMWVVLHTLRSFENQTICGPLQCVYAFGMDSALICYIICVI